MPTYYSESEIADVFNGSTRIDNISLGNSTVYEDNVVYYTITWQNYNGTVLQTSQVRAGVTPTYTGSTPSRASDVQYDYSFTGWSPTVGPATQNQTYVAQYTSTVRNYTITFSRNNSARGTLTRYSQTVPYGTTYSAPGVGSFTCNGVVTNATASVGCTFSGWSSTSGTVTGNMTITATFDVIRYTTTITGDTGYVYQIALNVRSSPLGGGTGTPTNGYCYGDTIRFTVQGMSYDDGTKVRLTSVLSGGASETIGTNVNLAIKDVVCNGNTTLTITCTNP